MNRITFIMFCILVSMLMFSTAFAKSDIIPKQSKIYIAPMENSMDQFIASEMIRQKVPVSIVMEERKAQYIVVGKAIAKTGSNKWYHYLSGTAGTRDSVQATISLVDKKEKSLLWSGNAGDRSVFWGVLKKGGERKAALRLVRTFKKDVFAKN